MDGAPSRSDAYAVNFPASRLGLSTGAVPEGWITCDFEAFVPEFASALYGHPGVSLAVLSNAPHTGEIRLQTYVPMLRTS